jgi:hypothetical protein
MSSGSSKPVAGAPAPASPSLVRRLFSPVIIGSRQLPSIALLVLATIGAILLAVVVTTFWFTPGDDIAYWLAGHRLALGQPIYPRPEVAFEPFAYHYPPPLAQALAPLTVVLSAVAYAALYRALMLLVLWDLAGRTMLQLLAAIGLLPVAVALRIENVEFFMAAAVVYGLWRWPWLFSIAGLVKASPGFGLIYLVMQRRWRDVGVAAAVGIAIVASSWLLDPGLWPAWFDAITGRADVIGNSVIPVPFWVRAATGFALALVAGFIGRRKGELILVVAVTFANPGLAVQSFAVLVAAIPIWRAGPEGLLGRRRATGTAGPGHDMRTRIATAVA